MPQTKRILITDSAKETIDTLRKRFGNELMFHQSGGCCDGSSPMCFEKGDFKVGSQDVWMGKVYGCDFFMSADQFEYWKHTQLTLDITPGRGSSFSIEIPMGIRFIIRSRIFTMEELENLEPILTGEEYLEQEA
ncbi:DUF779 domain-containing protein [Algoriphagus sp. NF]|jgi:hypothetical protein|uniref:DUF779 domain-containing protein n=1 Tax=Algoriphagus marincola TaxID=264027 RepID=A0ABS7MZL9_9BACT|nr:MULTISPECIES: DUF779 domain-containing protein [Algoriphagus]MBY5949504.1 DUF779 domain-containing protein [Algoriphagus marincola]MDE0558520.1 DUF779 domain-containing protein [Algoriphagus sp. NF]